MKLSLTLCTFPLLTVAFPAAKEPPLFTNITVFDPPDDYTIPRTLYARVRSLSCAKEDTLLATWENYLPSDSPDAACPPDCPKDPYIPIYASNDQGLTWHERAKVHDQVNGWGLRYQPELHELEEDIGDFPAGTLLLAANSIPADLSETKIDVYASKDEGYTWDFVSSVARGGRALPENQYTPIWEPFLLTYDHAVTIYYSDQREPAGESNLGQKLVHQTTSDVLTWGPVVDDVHYADPALRPGMPIISELPDGNWILTHEHFPEEGAPFTTYYKLSESPLTFDEKEDMPLVSANEPTPCGSPYNVWTPAGGENGTILVSDGCNTQLFVNKALGDPGAWTSMETPAGVSYTRSLLVMPEDASRVMIAAGGVLGGEDNEVLVTTIDVDGEGAKKPKGYGRGHSKGGKCKAHKGKGKGKGKHHGW